MYKKCAQWNVYFYEDLTKIVCRKFDLFYNVKCFVLETIMEK
jgi:hypothetical protein